MPPAIPARVSAIAGSQFDALNRAAARLRADGRPVINLGQGLPPFGPPVAAVRAFEAALSDPASHIYSGNAGLPALREVLSQQLQRAEGLDIDADDIIITAGGNQAFMLALQTVVDAGDEVLLPSPYFINHEMTIRVVGGVPVEVKTDEGDGFRVSWAALAEQVTPRTRAVVLCTPSNPTGACIGRDDMVEIVTQLAARGIVVVADETYMHFLHADRSDGVAPAHVSAAAVAGWRENVIFTSSFSKSFGVTGWRVGYLAAHPSVVEQAIKIQDTMVICAPVPAQAAMIVAVRDEWDYARRNGAVFTDRRRAIAESLAGATNVSWRSTPGAFFAFVKVNSTLDTVALAADVLEKTHIVTIPGTAFGAAGAGYLRVSYGAVSADELREAMARLVDYVER